MKKQVSMKFIQLLLLSATSAAMISCATATPEADTLTAKGGSQILTVQGVPGGVVTNVAHLSAKVSAIDYTNRQVTLEDELGKKKTLRVGPEAVNFDQVRVGDSVQIAVAEETVVFLRDKGAPAQDGAAGLIAKAPEGGKPGMLAASTVEVTTVVKAVDIPKHQATLQFPDGSTRVVAVRDDVALTQDRVGREVVIRITEAIAISVDKP
jgi:hypothetical protein